MTAGTPSDLFAFSSLSTTLKQLLTASRPRSTTRTCCEIELRGTKMTGALRLISSDTRNALIDSCWAAATALSATAALASRSFVFAASNRLTKLYNNNPFNSPLSTTTQVSWNQKNIHSFTFYLFGIICNYYFSSFTAVHSILLV